MLTASTTSCSLSPCSTCCRKIFEVHQCFDQNVLCGAGHSMTASAGIRPRISGLRPVSGTRLTSSWHVPDVFMTRRGRPEVIDVKPQRFVGHDVVPRQAELSEARCSRIGWVYRMATEPSAVAWVCAPRPAHHHWDDHHRRPGRAAGPTTPTPVPARRDLADAPAVAGAGRGRDHPVHS